MSRYISFGGIRYQKMLDGKLKAVRPIKRRVIRSVDPITIDMIAGPNEVTGDSRRALMRRREMVLLRNELEKELKSKTVSLRS